GPDLFGDLDLAGLARAQEVEGHGLLAVVAGQTARLAPLVDHGPQVAQAHVLAVADRHQGLAQLFDRTGGAQRPHGALRTRDGDAPARQVVIDAGQGLTDLSRRDAVGAQTLRIQLDADLAVHPAGAVDLADAAQRQQC